jgi:hypothetical protein
MLAFVLGVAAAMLAFVLGVAAAMLAFVPDVASASAAGPLQSAVGIAVRNAAVGA